MNTRMSRRSTACGPPSSVKHRNSSVGRTTGALECGPAISLTSGHRSSTWRVIGPVDKNLAFRRHQAAFYQVGLRGGGGGGGGVCACVRACGGVGWHSRVGKPFCTRELSHIGHQEGAGLVAKHADKVSGHADGACASVGCAARHATPHTKPCHNTTQHNTKRRGQWAQHAQRNYTTSSGAHCERPRAARHKSAGVADLNDCMTHHQRPNQSPPEHHRLRQWLPRHRCCHPQCGLESTCPTAAQTTHGHTPTWTLHVGIGAQP